MQILDFPVEVGKRAYDDDEKILLPGTYVSPDTSSSTLLIVESGWDRQHTDYIGSFAALLGKEFHVYVSELRHNPWVKGSKGNGLCKTSHCIDDLLQVHEHMQDLSEVENVFYLGHSMGAVIAAAAAEQLSSDISESSSFQPSPQPTSSPVFNYSLQGLYNMSAFPSYGDCFTASLDPKTRSIMHRLIDLFSAFDIGPIGSPLKYSSHDKPSRFAIAGDDHLLHTDNPTVAERFKTIFTASGDTSTAVFPERNHVFGTGDYHKLSKVTFNSYKPQELVDDIILFVYKLLDR